MSTLKGWQKEYGVSRVTFSAGGAATYAVTFTKAFISPPAILIVPIEADVLAGATYTATGISTTGFTISISGSQFVSQSKDINWFAHEKP